MKSRLSNQQPLKEVIDDWLAKHPAADMAKQTRVTHLWGALLGPSVKNRTTSLYFRNGILQVKLDSSVLRNECRLPKKASKKT